MQTIEITIPVDTGQHRLTIEVEWMRSAGLDDQRVSAILSQLMLIVMPEDGVT
jgi:hypothetical protein